MTNKEKGFLFSDYHIRRKTKKSLKYRLRRRTEEVLEAITIYKNNKINSLCDIGTADAMMLDILNQKLQITKTVGIDLSIDLLKTNTNPKLHLIQGDAIRLPFTDNSFDVAVATAVIEHVHEPDRMIAECYRILKQDGICIFTTPDPFFTRFGVKICLVKEEQHVKMFKLSELISLIKSKGFKVLKTEKFMMSPIGFPQERKIEKIFKLIGIGFFLLNQLVICQKSRVILNNDNNMML